MSWRRAAEQTGRAVAWFGALSAAIAGAAHLLLLGYIVVSRWAYPFDLEWMEGGMLCHALRLIDGKPIYGPPSVEFIPYLYTPLYPALVAAFGKIFGLSYGLGRAISVASFAATLVIAGFVVWRQRGVSRLQRLFWAIAAAGLVASTFPLTGAWYDLVRNDTLYLLLVLAGLVVLWRRGDRLGWLLFAGALMGLAFLAKQTASVFIVFSGFIVLVRWWRRLPLYVAAVGVVAGGTVLWLNARTDGWFWTYIFKLHQQHSFFGERAWPGTGITLFELFPAVFVVLLAGTVALVARALIAGRVVPADRAVGYFVGLGVVGVAVSAIGFGTQWAYLNAYIPGLVFPAVAAALIGPTLQQGRGVGTRWIGQLLAGAAGVALAVQLAMQLYDPRPHIPKADDYQRGGRLIELVQSFDGSVLIPYHPYYAVLAGKAPSMHHMGIKDIRRAGYSLPRGLTDRVRKRVYDAVILDYRPQVHYGFVRGPYRVARMIPAKDAPRVFTGAKIRPTYLLTPTNP